MAGTYRCFYPTDSSLIGRTQLLKYNYLETIDVIAGILLVGVISVPLLSVRAFQLPTQRPNRLNGKHWATNIRVDYIIRSHRTTVDVKN